LRWDTVARKMFGDAAEVRVNRGKQVSQNEAPLHIIVRRVGPSPRERGCPCISCSRVLVALSPDDMESIFEKRIRPDYEPVVRRDDPRLVCVAAQPGAGKTDNPALVFSGREATRICGDDFKIAHPRYLELLAADPRTAGERIRPVYQEWQRRMESLVRDLRGDVVIELSPGPDGKLLEDVALYRAVGYRVELVVLAVRKADSRQGISLRYARALTSPWARFTSVAGHDVCFQALAEVLAAVERESAVHSVQVVRRDGTVLHHSERDAAGSRGEGAGEALRKEWERPYTPEEAEVFLENQEELYRTLPEYCVEWDDIAALADRLMPLSLN
jgi:hypothetical protein